MAGRKKKYIEPAKAGWMMTFADLVTLMFTFFVLLLSMAVIDERSKLVVLGSVNRHFGFEENSSFNPTESEHRTHLNEPGAMDLPQDELASLRNKVFDRNEDLDFQENKFVQILSINERVLFTQGGTELSPEGVDLLDTFLPYFQRIEHPLLIAGHTASRREEEGDSYTVSLNEKELDTTWLLSFKRATSIYKHLINRGVPADKIMVEAFGQFHPRYTNNTPEGRHKNRRVDIVLDKRNRAWIEKMEQMQKTGEIPKEAPIHYVGGFRFDLTMPGERTGGEDQ